MNGLRRQDGKKASRRWLSTPTCCRRPRFITVNESGDRARGKIAMRRAPKELGHFPPTQEITFRLRNHRDVCTRNIRAGDDNRLGSRYLRRW